MRLNPNDAYALHALGNKSDFAGDPAGIGHMERAQTLNPEDALRHTHLTFLARAYIAAGNPAAGLERARQALRRQPKSAPAHYIIALALAHLGRKQEAEAALAACEDLSAGFVTSRLEWRPYADAARNARLAEGLRLAKG